MTHRTFSTIKSVLRIVGLVGLPASAAFAALLLIVAEGFGLAEEYLTTPAATAEPPKNV